MKRKSGFKIPKTASLPGDNRADAVYEFDGRRYYLLQMKTHVLYCAFDAEGKSSRLLFVPSEAFALARMSNGKLECTSENLEFSGQPFLYPEETFRNQVRGGQSGRFVRYKSPLARDCSVALFFMPNGTGKFCDCYSDGYSPRAYSPQYEKAHVDGQIIDFVWEGGKCGIAAFADILTCSREISLPLCEEVFMQQIWPRMENPFVNYADYPDEPLRFTCGSQEELEQITRCVCHLDEGAFDGSHSGNLEVKYAADTPERKGGFKQREYSEASAWYENGVNFWFGERSRILIHMASQRNTFSGAKWQAGRGGPRRLSYRLMPEEITVRVAPPSAHERAEALLTLWDWLEGKVTEEERRRLLRVDASMIQEADEHGILL